MTFSGCSGCHKIAGLYANMCDLWKVDIEVGCGGNCGVILWLGGGCHTKIQQKEPKYHSLSHNGALADLNMVGINKKCVDHTQIHLGCKGA